ncbi:MAG: PepSY domain-containing protein [Verrucomicrobiales bacterium]|nr:PepSY domain-containing protein [Verrucomicrobiales bacterium]
MKSPANPLKPRHRLLAWARRWHAWGGLIAAIFLVVVGSTGILLNYKKSVLSALGLEPAGAPQRSKPNATDGPKVLEIDFSTLTGLGAAGIPAGQAIAVAREDLGSVALDRIELKREAGVLVWKIKGMDDREVIVDAQTGSSYLKGRYEKVVSTTSPGRQDRATDWGKIALDLHTGKLGGEVGKAFMTVVAAVLVFLSLSGVYLYAKPVLIRRANAQARNVVTAKSFREPSEAKPREVVSAALCDDSCRS